MTIKQQVVDRLLGKTERMGYHIFADGRDEYTWDYDEAIRIYNQWCKEYDNIRLWTFYEDGRKSGDIRDGDYIKGKGDYPM